MADIRFAVILTLLPLGPALGALGAAAYQRHIGGWNRLEKAMRLSQCAAACVLFSSVSFAVLMAVHPL